MNRLRSLLHLGAKPHGACVRVWEPDTYDRGDITPGLGPRGAVRTSIVRLEGRYRGQAENVQDLFIVRICCPCVGSQVEWSH